LGDKPFHNFSH